LGHKETGDRTHDYFETYLTAYLDGELDLVTSMDVESHFEECPHCRKDFKDQQTLRKSFRTNLPYFNAPSKLRKNVLSSVRQEIKTAEKPDSVSWRWLGLAASFAIVGIIAFSIAPLLYRQSSDQRLTEDIVSGHVRSLMLPEHTIDVLSTDEHTVKPWFNGKLDFAPPVKNLTDDGFPLFGGRIEHMDNRTVAALVYRRQQHYINLYIWPSTDKKNQIESTRQGYNVIHWACDGMTFWAVSDVNVNDLQNFARLIQE
jgi:anti-sigma factor RsiW